MGYQLGGEVLLPAGQEPDGRLTVPDDHGLAAPTDLTSVVHDLTNNLTVVLGSLEQLRRQPLDERGRQQLERADRGAERAGKLVYQIFALASAAGSDTKAP